MQCGRVLLPILLCGFFVSIQANSNSSCPKIISRSEWNARSPIFVKKLSIIPPPYVVVHHSATIGCSDETSCAKLVRSIQNYHMDNNHWEDIGYNFLIGGDGSIFEGRGWGIHGAHSPPYNSRSIGICLLGNFMQITPSTSQTESLEKLIECGVEEDQIEVDYHLIGHRQASATLCPGNILFDIIKKWSHFDNHPKDE